MNLILRRATLAGLFVLAVTSATTLAQFSSRPVMARSQHRNIIIRERHGTTVTSSNWSGYAVTGAKGSVSDAKGSWTVPTASCGSTPNAYSATWVGIDGYNSNTVEQIGTETDCAGGKASNYAWFEFYPHNYFTVENFSIKPGDTISAEVKYSGGKFTVSIKDVATNETFSTSTKLNQAERSSAEWIVEAPYSGGVLPLTDFQNQQFGATYTNVGSTCDATIGSASGGIGSFPAADVFNMTMTADNGTPKAVTSPLSNDNSSFVDSWVSEGP